MSDEKVKITLTTSEAVCVIEALAAQCDKLDSDFYVAKWEVDSLQRKNTALEADIKRLKAKSAKKEGK